jgi:hypothetical protein
MRFALALSLAMLSMSPIATFAAEKCACTQECMDQCQKGKGADCKCKSCDCKKSGKCSEGQCATEHKH